MERARVRARAWQAGGAQGGGGTFFISSRVRQQRRCRARGGGPQGQISPPSCKMQVGTGRGGRGERELGGTVFPRPSVSPKSLGVPLCVQPRWGSGRFLPKSLGCWTRQHFRTLTPPDGHPDHGEPAASFPPWVLEQHVANVSGLFSCPTQQPGRRLSRYGEKGRLGGGRPRRVGAASRKRQASAPEGRARGLLSFPRVPMVLGAADCGLATAPGQPSRRLRGPLRAPEKELGVQGLERRGRRMRSAPHPSAPHGPEGVCSSVVPFQGQESCKSLK